MAKLPHFKNSKASMNNWEPVFLNLFEVTFIPPNGVKGKDLLLEHVNSVSGLEIDKNPALVEQKYQHATRRFAGSSVETTTLDVVINFSVNLNDSNQMYIYNTLRDWCDIIYNPLTGSFGLKKDYVGTIVITAFNKAGDVFKKYTLLNAFPMSPLPALDLEYEKQDLFEIEMTFAIDHFDEERT